MTSALDVAATRSSTLLVERARAGDVDAFDRLTGAHVDGAFRTALAILRSEADASDAVQDAFVTAWRELPRLREPERFAAWLGRIVANRCRSQLRHRRVVARTVVAPPRDWAAGNSVPIDPRPQPSDAVADADAIRRAFERLRPDDRVLVILHHVEGRPLAEIASTLGMPEGTAKWRLHGARQTLAKLLEVER